jgi:hypothetical protein
VTAVDTDLEDRPEPKRPLLKVVVTVAVVVLAFAWIRRRLRRSASDTVFDVVEESAATLAEVLVDELLPG